MKLNQNENLFGPSPKVVDVMRDFCQNSVDLALYPKKQQVLESVLAKLLGIKEANIILGYGGEGLLRYVFENLLVSNGKCLISNYAWDYYTKQFERLDIEFSTFAMLEHQDAFEFDVTDLIEKCKVQQFDLLLITSPNNPTGNSLSFEQLELILESVSKNTYVLIDEAYYGFDKDYDDMKLKDLLEKYPNLLVLRTFSKLYGLVAMRVAYLLVGDTVLQKLKYQPLYLGFNQLSEQMAEAALDDGQYYEDIVDQVKVLREDLFNFVNQKLSLMKAFKSKANFVLIEFPIELKEDLQEFLQNHQIFVRFYSVDELNNKMRITIGKAIHMNRLKEVLLEFNRKYENLSG